MLAAPVEAAAVGSSLEQDSMGVPPWELQAALLGKVQEQAVVPSEGMQEKFGPPGLRSSDSGLTEKVGRTDQP